MRDHLFEIPANKSPANRKSFSNQLLGAHEIATSKAIRDLGAQINDLIQGLPILSGHRSVPTGHQQACVSTASPGVFITKLRTN